MKLLQEKDIITRISGGAKIIKDLPGGFYELHETMTEGIFIQEKKILTDSIINIPGSDSDKILQEVSDFIKPEVRKLYDDYGMTYKKGFLLHGSAGCGKTMTAIRSAQKLVEQQNAIIIYNPTPFVFTGFLSTYSEVLEDRMVCVLMEEFENIYQSYPTEILSLLDGESQVDNFVIIACTNYIEQLPERIKSRPSRFSTVIEVGPPSAEVRRIFIKGKVKEYDSDLLEPIVDATEGFTLDQVKDVIISICIFKKPISEAVLKIKEMKDNSLGEENLRTHHTNQYLGELKKELFGVKNMLRKK